MGDYFYSEEMVAAIRKIARREGVEITDEQILNEVFGKKQKSKVVKIKTPARKRTG